MLKFCEWRRESTLLPPALSFWPFHSAIKISCYSRPCLCLEATTIMVRLRLKIYYQKDWRILSPNVSRISKSARTKIICAVYGHCRQTYTYYEYVHQRYILHSKLHYIFKSLHSCHEIALRIVNICIRGKPFSLFE